MSEIPPDRSAEPRVAGRPARAHVRRRARARSGRPTHAIAPELRRAGRAARRAGAAHGACRRDDARSGATAGARADPHSRYDHGDDARADEDDDEHVAGRDRVIGYLAVTAQEPLFYLGGVLVADEYGLPVEFRHTLPVRPTKLQRALYGAALDRYLRSVVIAQRLVVGPRARPGRRAGLRRDARARGAPAARVPGGVRRRSRRHSRAPSSRSPAPARASCCSCARARPRCGWSPRRRVHLYPEIGRALVEAAETMDLFEPMERVRAGLALIAAGDVGLARVIRRAAARRDGDDLAGRPTRDLGFAVGLRTVDPPPVTGVATALAAGDRRARAVRRRRRGRRARARHLGDRRRRAGRAGRRAVRDPLAVGAPRPGRAAIDAAARRRARGLAEARSRAAGDHDAPGRRRSS